MQTFFGAFHGQYQAYDSVDIAPHEQNLISARIINIASHCYAWYNDSLHIKPLNNFGQVQSPRMRTHRKHILVVSWPCPGPSTCDWRSACAAAATS